MARKRMIDPEFFLDEELSHITPHARLLYIGLWGICDDNYATFPDRPDWIKAQIFPYEEIDTRRVLDELSQQGKIVAFTADDNKTYWYLKNFFKYQRVDRPSKPKYPEFTTGKSKKKSPKKDTLDESSTSTRPEVKLREEKLSKDKLREVKGIALAEANATQPETSTENLQPKQKAKLFFDGVERLKHDKDAAPWLSEMLRLIAERNQESKGVIWKGVIAFTDWWTEKTHDGTRERWQMQKTFEVEKRLTTWFKREGLKGFNARAMKVNTRGKGIIGLDDSD